MNSRMPTRFLAFFRYRIHPYHLIFSHLSPFRNPPLDWIFLHVACLLKLRTSNLSCTNRNMEERKKLREQAWNVGGWSDTVQQVRLVVFRDLDFPINPTSLHYCEIFVSSPSLFPSFLPSRLPPFQLSVVMF